MARARSCFADSATLSCGLFLGAVSLLFQIHSYNRLGGGLAVWASAGAWEERNCKVISAGASCRPESEDGPCWGFQGADAAPTLAGPPVFSVQDLAICPGIYHCADEGGTCDCRGTVIFYGPSLGPATYADAQHAPRLSAEHPMDCSVEAFGSDPQPYVSKSCWCIPESTQQAVLAGTGDDDDLTRTTWEATWEVLRGIAACTQTSDEDYQKAIEQGVTSRRLLERGGNQELTNSSGPQPQRREEDEDRAEEADGEPRADKAPARRLSSSRRRRRTFLYQPWAYVEVQASQDSFASEPAKPMRACAFQFAAMDPSDKFDDFTSSGPDDTVADTADNWVRTWMAQGGKCWVQTSGPRDIGGCAVGMEDPRQLVEKNEAMVAILWYLATGLFFGGLMCILPAMCFKWYKERTANDGQDSTYGRMP